MFQITSTEKIVGFSDGNILSLCPTMDLIVISMNKMSIWVFRLNGERIYSVNNKAIIRDLCWSPDGKYFCVSGVDGYCNIYNSNNGELLSHLGFQGPIEVINWEDNANYSQSYIDCQENPQESELFEVDLINELPRCNDIEDIGELNYLIVNSDSNFSIIFNNLFQINVNIDLKFIKNSNQDLFNQYYLIDDGDGISLTKLILPNSQSVVTIIKNFCKIQKILNNFDNQISNLNQEINQFFVAFDRVLSNFNDNLQENNLSGDGQCIKNQLSETLVTDLVPEFLKDYWLNQFGDRNFKKLTKLGNSVYDSIRNILFKNMVNSLDRMVIILNQLVNLITWNDMNYGNDFNINKSQLHLLIEKSKSVIKFLYQIIWDCNKEQRLFNEFLNWTKYLMDLLTKENNGEEIRSLGPNKAIDLLKYFNSHLLSSSILKYFKVDYSGFDIFKDQSLDTFLVDRIDDLKQLLLLELFEKFSSFFQSIMITEGPVKIQSVTDHKSITFKVFNKQNYGLICTNDDNLNIIKFSLQELAISNIINLPFKAINYKLCQDSIISLVSDEQGCNLQLHRYNDLFQNVHSPIVAQPFPQDQKYLLINELRSYGCLMNTNRKDYCIFQL